MEFKIDNMTCGGCARSVAKTLQSVDPSAKVEADTSTRRVKIETSGSSAALLKALEEAGYPAAAP